MSPRALSLSRLAALGCLAGLPLAGVGCTTDVEVARHLGAAGTGAVQDPRDRADRQDPPGLVPLATHPRASRQPTDRGKTLSTLFPWRDRLYAGYGDYGDNTGPIAIMPFDPATGDFEEVHVSDTEAIDNYREIGDRLFAPAIDRRRNADYASGPPWQDHNPLNTTHAYDMVTLDGDDLWLVGSHGANATAWRSLDGGESWNRVLSVPPESRLENDFARFYFAGVLNGNLYVQARDYRGDIHRHSRVFDGTRWSRGPTLVPDGSSGWRPVSFARHLVYQSAPGRGYLMAYDGATVRVARDGIAEDVVVADNDLYVLWEWHTDLFQIRRTSDLERWSCLNIAAPEVASSLAVLDGRPFIGGRDSRIYGLGSDAEPEWEVCETDFVVLPQVELVWPQPDGPWIAPATLVMAAEVDASGGPYTLDFWVDEDRFREVRWPHVAVDEPLGAGTYTVSARAIAEGARFTSDLVTIEVQEGENAPPRLSAPIQISPASPAPHQQVSFSVEAEDPDGDTLQWLWAFGPEADVAIGTTPTEAEGGLVQGRVASRRLSSPGVYNVDIYVADGRGGVVSESTTLIVGSRSVYMPLAQR